jgi:hypothetical protein
VADVAGLMEKFQVYNNDLQRLMVECVITVLEF